MFPGRTLTLATALLAGVLACPRQARALLYIDNGNPNGTPDQVLVEGYYAVGYDTNVFAQKVAKSAMTSSFGCSASYLRRAGLISITAASSLDYNLYSGAGVQGQNFYTPNLSLTLAKGVGRTTGSLTLNARKTDQPDPIANDKPVAWNYGANLSLRYPVMGRYYLANQSGFAGTYYTDKALFTDLDAYSDSLGLYYRYDSKLDLSAMGRFGYDTTKDTRAYDYAGLLGATGTDILPKLSGNLALGYDWRHSVYSRTPNQDFAGLTSETSLSWRYSRTLSFSGTFDRDYSISSTDLTTNTSSFGLNCDAALGKRLRSTLGLVYIITDFLGPDSGARKDHLWEVRGDLGTALTTHIRANLAFAYMENFSNIGNADFVRETVTLTVTATY